MIRENTVRSEILWEEISATSSMINLENTTLLCSHIERMKEESLPKNVAQVSTRRRRRRKEKEMKMRR
jgi:hypothetical protein